GDRVERSFCQDITPPLHSRLLSLRLHLRERAYGQSPPHLDPEETDEGREMKRLSAHLMDGGVHEAAMSKLVWVNVICRFKFEPDKQIISKT
ncbi:hypothetical protein ABVT39_021340, partial [Epinephelus coioides]